MRAIHDLKNLKDLNDEITLTTCKIKLARLPYGRKQLKKRLTTLFKLKKEYLEIKLGREITQNELLKIKEIPNG